MAKENNNDPIKEAELGADTPDIYATIINERRQAETLLNNANSNQRQFMDSVTTQLKQAQTKVDDVKRKKLAEQEANAPVLGAPTPDTLTQFHDEQKKAQAAPKRQMVSLTGVRPIRAKIAMQTAVDRFNQSHNDLGDKAAAEFYPDNGKIRVTNAGPLPFCDIHTNVDPESECFNNIILDAPVAQGDTTAIENSAIEATAMMLMETKWPKIEMEGPGADATPAQKQKADDMMQKVYETLKDMGSKQILVVDGEPYRPPQPKVDVAQEQEQSSKNRTRLS